MKETEPVVTEENGITYEEYCQALGLSLKEAREASVVKALAIHLGVLDIEHRSMT